MVYKLKNIVPEDGPSLRRVKEALTKTAPTAFMFVSPGLQRSHVSYIHDHFKVMELITLSSNSIASLGYTHRLPTRRA